MDYLDGALARIHYANQVDATLDYDAHARQVGVELSRQNVGIARIADALGDDDVPRLRRRTFGAQPVKTDIYETDLAGRVTVENLGLLNVPPLAGAASNSSVDRLRDAGAPSIGYALDGASNWSQRTGVGAFTPVIDAANRYGSIDSTAVAYNDQGSLQSFGDEKYGWNGLEQLTSVARNGQSETFTYDALGRRVRERAGQSSTFVVWDGETILASGSDGDVNAAQLRIALGADQTIALIAERGTGSPTYLHPGMDSSTFAATDGTGALVEGYSYSAYGETSFVEPGGGSIAASKIGNRFLYQGQLYDAVLGLYSMRAREYKPTWGRFLSPDPLGVFGGPNLYAFVAARPLLFSDPSGLSGHVDRSFYSFTGSTRPPSPAWQRLETIRVTEPNFFLDSAVEDLRTIGDQNVSQWRRVVATIDYYMMLAPASMGEGVRGVANTPYALFAGSQTTVDGVTAWDPQWSTSDKVVVGSHMVGGVAQSVGAALAGGAMLAGPNGFVSANESTIEGTAAPSSSQGIEFQIADRVNSQLADSRLGPLAGQITPEQLQVLANNPNALRFADTATGNLNIVQVLEGRLLRITTAGDDPTKIISVGPMQRSGLFNGIANGRFVPIIQ